MLNVHALTESEIRRRKAFRCVHRHDGFSHSNCFDQANNLVEKVAYFDIESSNLTSDFGCVLTYALKSDDVVISNKITPQEIKDGSYDKRLLADLCVDLRKFRRVITWYGSKFDIPFVRSRCILHKHDFPLYKEILHTDAYMIAKNTLRTLHSKRLGVVAEFYGIEAKQHPLNPTVWLRCLSGDQESIDFVQTHNIEDVVSLEKVCKRAIFPYTKLAKTSI